jgi:CheY-like chemotaxis protein
MSTADPAATILLVEDDAPTRTFLADNLTADGYELLVADCARDGLRLLETKFPDVALVDLGLPDGSGLDVVRRVRASDGVASRIDPAVPLVVLSGRAGELDRLRGFERGCDDYVCKLLCAVVSPRSASRLAPARSAITSSTTSGRRLATMARPPSSSRTTNDSK